MSETAELVQAAITLGLEAVKGGAEGFFEGQRVSLHTEYEGNGPTLTVVRGWLSRPLDLGLEMHRRELASMSDHEGITGNSDLDAELAIRGDEKVRVRAFFNRTLCEHLLAMHRRAQDVRLRDVGCSLLEPSVNVAERRRSWLSYAFHTAAHTVNLLDEARAGVPVPTSLLAHAEALQAFASRRNLRWTLTPLLAEGRLEERRLQVGSVRTGRRQHRLGAQLGFSRRPA